MSIEEIINKTVAIEGGYSNHPDDKGGETMFGITIAVARANGYLGSMRYMPRSIALDIFRKEYFDNPKFNLVYQISPAIAEELFDTGVNMGTPKACKIFQEALNLLNQNGKLYSNLTVDGVIGAKSVAALEIVLNRTNGERIMLKVLNGLQFENYVEICRAKENQEVFFWGWTLQRVA